MEFKKNEWKLLIDRCKKKIGFLCSSLTEAITRFEKNGILKPGKLDLVEFFFRATLK